MHLPILSSPTCQSIVDATARRVPPPLALPVNIGGTVAKPGEERQTWFVVKKGERYTFTARGGTIGSPLDRCFASRTTPGRCWRRPATLPSGVTRGSIGPPRRTAPIARPIRDLFGRGGADFDYRLEVSRPGPPSISATTDADAYALVPGKTATVKVNVAAAERSCRRARGGRNRAPVRRDGDSAEVPAKGGEVTLTLTAAADAKPASGLIRVLSARDGAVQAGERRGGLYDLRKDRDKAGNQEYIDSIAELWVTVSPTATVTPKAAP